MIPTNEVSAKEHAVEPNKSAERFFDIRHNGNLTDAN